MNELMITHYVRIFSKTHPYTQMVGAEGLDLIVASHVFLLEPLVNQAMERQAVNRVHRIGQTKQTKIHKYVVLGK